MTFLFASPSTLFPLINIKFIPFMVTANEIVIFLRGGVIFLSCVTSDLDVIYQSQAGEVVKRVDPEAAIICNGDNNEGIELLCKHTGIFPM